MPLICFCLPPILKDLTIGMTVFQDCWVFVSFFFKYDLLSFLFFSSPFPILPPLLKDWAFPWWVKERRSTRKSVWTSGPLPWAGRVLCTDIHNSDAEVLCSITIPQWECCTEYNLTPGMPYRLQGKDRVHMKEVGLRSWKEPQNWY